MPKPCRLFDFQLPEKDKELKIAQLRQNLPVARFLWTNHFIILFLSPVCPREWYLDKERVVSCGLCTTAPHPSSDTKLNYFSQRHLDRHGPRRAWGSFLRLRFKCIPYWAKYEPIFHVRLPVSSCCLRWRVCVCPSQRLLKPSVRGSQCHLLPIIPPPPSAPLRLWPSKKAPQGHRSGLLHNYSQPRMEGGRFSFHLTKAVEGGEAAYFTRASWAILWEGGGWTRSATFLALGR